MPSLTISVSLKSSLRSSVAASSYGVLGFVPSLVFDFKTNTYKTGGAGTTFSSAITHAATTNATMVDSDGLLKWRPHNLQVHSGDFSNSAWSKASSTVDTSYVAPDGTSTASKLTGVGGAGATGLYDSNPRGTGMSLTCFMKAGSSGVYGWIEGIVGGISPYGVFDLENGTVVHSRQCDASIESVGNGWFRCVLANTTSNISFFSVGGSDNFYTNSNPWASSSLAQGKFIYAWGAQLNRSDLGGMVSNPDASTGLESYVPTTTTPVYSPRRGQHAYNGSAWVNEGILHESEARTNQMLYSGDLNGSGWTGQGTAGTVTAGSPFGTYQTISPSANGSNVGPAQRYQIGKSITSGSTYVGWALVKYSVGSGWFAVNMYDTGKASEQAWFDLQNGVVGSKQPLIIDHGMVDYGDGWWLCWASANAASTSGGLSVEITNGDGVQSCSAADVILIAGSQFELGSTPSSYISTTFAQVTRAAETLTVPAANLPYDNTNMSIQIDGKMTYADTSNGFEVVPYWWKRGGTDFIHSQLSTVGGRTGQIEFFQRQSTSGQDVVRSVTNAYSPDTNVPFNIATRNGSTFINGAHEGTLLTANTTPTILPDLSTIDLNLGFVFMGTIGQFRMWDEDITDAGITEAST